MSEPSIGRRGLLAAALLGAAAGLSLSGPAPAAETVQMISHRFPALEFYAEKMREALPGVEVNTS